MLLLLCMIIFIHSMGEINRCMIDSNEMQFYIHIVLYSFDLDYNCPANQKRKKVIKLNAGDSFSFNTNPEGGDR